jgi:hypothetical protein
VPLPLKAEQAAALPDSVGFVTADFQVPLPMTKASINWQIRGRRGTPRPCTTGRGRTSHQQPDKHKARLQVPLGGSRLPPALGAPHCLRNRVEQTYAVGRAAVEFALAGRSAVMPAIRRLSGAPYRWEIIPVPLSEVPN